MSRDPVKRGLKAFEKSFDPCQPAQSAQADMDRNFSLSLNFSACQKTVLHCDSSGYFVDP